MYAATSGFAFLQNQRDGAQPISIFKSLDKSVEFFGDVNIPNFYDKAEVDNLVSGIYDEVCTKLEVDAIDDELSNLFLHTYTKTETDNLIPSIALTGSENINSTNNQACLTFPLKVNGEIVMSPRAYGVQFELYAGTSGCASLQNQRDGAQPIAIFKSIDQSVEFFGDLDIPNFYNKAEVNNLLANNGVILDNYYTKAQVDTLLANINLSDCFTNTEIDTQLTGYVTNTYLLDLLNTYVPISLLILFFFMIKHI